jgi:hypothetical protein
MIFNELAARHAKSQILAASSTTEGPKRAFFCDAETSCWDKVDSTPRSDPINAQTPIKLSKTQDSPPTLVLKGESAKVSVNTTKASLGKG